MSSSAHSDYPKTRDSTLTQERRNDSNIFLFSAFRFPFPLLLRSYRPDHNAENLPSLCHRVLRMSQCPSVLRNTEHTLKYSPYALPHSGLTGRLRCLDVPQITRSASFPFKRRGCLGCQLNRGLHAADE
ncbi:hypothetical protein H112_06836 [Trichophyton rubrum D6]|uniref:Uncharacterized protein n=3 Tax=Trichophyton TaxID=5550 RepID=F2SG59_TRIRC|nr:uncharacterized protein TERG_02185 [Trichophyton rubrum CBS 118892]EZF12214.1 hypothetical protein H100_06860 [Trichophyton rubrum MR850]EZF39070.1 hypothetical protein H102_06820 [Trichophyton rubrum CBS 100081]EZF49636.1 hypothetical protein H103_06845 [Trichophyton rubrum CBS 288.86]EZF60347.1 hypothetical protein H104_06798 [Trichophyton rubrum CBS 289.86]EZF70945.1 hypothetical protein H105_06861 [Trichophyton soudanense CBS 452.61]EZF81621.1 hypothetical protein H110_06839 [Trichophy